MATCHRLDAIVVSSYGFLDVVQFTTDGAFLDFELYLDRHLADFRFLRSYFRNNRDLQRTQAEWAALPLKAKMPTYLSGAYISDFLRKKMQLNVRTINSFSHEKHRLDEFLRQRPEFAIISTTLIVLPENIREITRYIRERSPETTIILGGLKMYKSYKIRKLWEAGAIPDFTQERLARYHHFLGPKTDDGHYYIINTRGEHTLLRLLNALRNGDDVLGMENLAYYTDPQTCHINPITEEPDYLTNSRVDWASVEEEIIGDELPISFKQGCPYRCNFCEFIELDRKISTRSLDLVMTEIRQLRDRFGITSIYFVDENLFFSKQQLREFCARLRKEQLGIRWRGQTRVTCLDKEAAEMLKESGCYSLALGLESGDDTVLRNMNKKSTAEENYDAVCNANHAGIDVYATFVVGFPGETEKTFENTVDMVKGFPSGNGAFNFYRAFPFLLTPLCPAATCDFRKAHNLTGGQNWWEHPTMNFKQAADMVREMFLAVDNVFYRYLNSTEATALRNDIPQHRTILETRQRLAQGRISGREEVDEPTLWDTMARAYQELDQGI